MITVGEEGYFGVSQSRYLSIMAVFCPRYTCSSAPEMFEGISQHVGRWTDIDCSQAGSVYNQAFNPNHDGTRWPLMTGQNYTANHQWVAEPGLLHCFAMAPFLGSRPPNENGRPWLEQHQMA